MKQYSNRRILRELNIMPYFSRYSPQDKTQSLRSRHECIRLIGWQDENIRLHGVLFHRMLDDDIALSMSVLVCSPTDTCKIGYCYFILHTPVTHGQCRTVALLSASSNYKRITGFDEILELYAIYIEQNDNNTQANVRGRFIENREKKYDMFTGKYYNGKVKKLTKLSRSDAVVFIPMRTTPNTILTACRARM